MYQTIDEAIEVIGIFKKTGFRPVKFQWRGRTYPVAQITLVSDTKDGGVRGRVYSVVSGREVYRLDFNRDTERWTLRELWVE